MPKELCLIYANCQGEPLEGLLCSSPGFSDRYETLHYVNFLAKGIPHEELSRCGLFLYQELGAKWGELSTAEVIKRLPGSCGHVVLPNMFFKGYWPFWTRERRFDFSDLYLNALIERGLNKSEILYLYLRTDIRRKYDIQAIFEESLAREREKEQLTDIKTVDYVLQMYKKERVFLTINHPAQRFLVFLANEVLQMTGHELLPEESIRNMPKPYEDFELPVHPQVIDFFGLRCFSQDQRYRVFGKEMTFEQYVSHYVDCKLQGFEHFIGYLQLVK